MSQILISMPENEFWAKMETLVKAQVKEAQPKSRPSTKTYSINQVAKILQKGHETIKKFIHSGVINISADGRISEAELDRYFKSLS